MSIGSTLQAARESAGLTIEALSDATRVREHILVAMERDDFAACRGDFYARGHLRNVAAQLGLDPDPLLAAYQVEHGGEPAPPASLLIRPRQPREEDRPKRPNWSAALGIALLVGGGLAVAAVSGGEDELRQTELLAAPQAAGPGAPAVDAAAGLPADPAADNADQSPALSRPRGPGTEELAEAAARETGPPPAEEPEGAQGAEGAPDARSEDSSVVVQVVATDTSWVSASDGSGDTLYEGTLRDGDTKSFADRRRVRLVVGNPDGVRVVVDGQEVDLADDRNGVARLEYEAAPARS